MKRRIFKNSSVALVVLILVLALTGPVGAMGVSVNSRLEPTLQTIGVDNTQTPAQLAGLLVGTGPGAPTISNVVFTGDSRGAGVFRGGSGSVGIDSGVILSSGSVIDAMGPHSDGEASTLFGLPGDAALDSLIPGYTTFDATTLEFDFECPAGSSIQPTISFSYVFASDEYNDWVNSSNNDVFGLFLNGANIALLPNTTIPIAVNNVNDGYPSGFTLPGINPSNPLYYRNNESYLGGGNIDIKANGLTVVLAAKANLLPGKNHMRLAIADGGDYGIDSWAFIQGVSSLCAPPGQPPVANAGGPYNVNEGSMIRLDGTGSSDPDGDALTYGWKPGSSLCSLDDATSATPNLTCTDNGVFTTTLAVYDGQTVSTDTATITVNNVNPTVNITSVSPTLVPVGGSVTANGSFTDPGIKDTHTAAWNWGDGISNSGTVTQGAGFGSVANSHTYTTPGVYTIQLSVTDNDAGTGAATYQYVVVYDPNAGFVTGDGWIDSPLGAYKLDQSLGGKATFGFVSQYKKGASIPTGNTDFQFRAAGFFFHSETYEWLVVNQTGINAQFKGSGNINGGLDPNGNAYKFMLWAGDGSPDTFRIKIWWEDGTEHLVYDNGINQPLGGGSIMIHKTK